MSYMNDICSSYSRVGRNSKRKGLSILVQVAVVEPHRLDVNNNYLFLQFAVWKSKSASMVEILVRVYRQPFPSSYPPRSEGELALFLFK